MKKGIQIVNGLMTNMITAAIVAGTVAACSNAYKTDAAEIKCLADNIYFEALTESTAGQVAVGNVTMNRVTHSAFPDTVCDVVWERKQFSWTHDGKSDTPSSKKAYDEVYEIAKAVYNGNVMDITEGATFYHADYVNPSWNKDMKRVAKIDTHIFYTHKGR